MFQQQITLLLLIGAEVFHQGDKFVHLSLQFGLEMEPLVVTYRN